jgi:hypothetical protein
LRREHLRLARLPKLAETVRCLPRQFKGVKVADPWGIFGRVALRECLLGTVQHLRAHPRVATASEGSCLHRKEHSTYSCGYPANGTGLRRPRELKGLIVPPQIVGLVAEVGQQAATKNRIFCFTRQAKTLHEISLCGTMPPRVISTPAKQLRNLRSGTKNLTTDRVWVRLTQ